MVDAWNIDGLVVESQGHLRSTVCPLPLAYLLQILPWDSDVDVQMTVDTLSFLASYYNMSVFHYHLPHIPQGRDYLFEINPGFATEGQFDQLNMIDARWIDTETGLFIDVTTVRPNQTARALGVDGALKCKDRHSYLVRMMAIVREGGSGEDGIFLTLYGCFLGARSVSTEG